MSFTAAQELATRLGGRSCSPDPRTAAWVFEDARAEARFQAELEANGVSNRFWSGAVSVSMGDLS